MKKEPNVFLSQHVNSGSSLAVITQKNLQSDCQVQPQEWKKSYPVAPKTLAV